MVCDGKGLNHLRSFYGVISIVKDDPWLDFWGLWAIVLSEEALEGRSQIEWHGLLSLIA
jgi:hypothetical protein